MGLKLTQTDINKLAAFVNANNREGYYSYLASKGDGYANMALGVVDSTTMAGAIANEYAKSVSFQFDDTLTLTEWNQTYSSLATDLMERDFAMRMGKFSSGASDQSLTHQEIRQYHNIAYESAGLPKEAWTAEIVLAEHSNPGAWWQSQINNGGVNSIQDFIALMNTMTSINAAEAATYRSQWYNSNGTINNNTANNPEWMITHMPGTFWSQQIYSPGGVMAALNGLAQSLPATTTATLFEAGQSMSQFFDSVMKSTNDVLQTVLSDGFRAFLSEFNDIALDWFQSHTYFAGYPTGGEFAHYYPIDSNISVYTANFDRYSSLLNTFSVHKVKFEKIEQKTGDSYEYIDENGNVVTMLPKLIISVQEGAVINSNYIIALYDPLVLDLNGDGVHTISARDSASNFLTDGGEYHGWLSPEDGFLIMDRNQNGLVDDIDEMFGSNTVNGFSVLQRLDSNADGVIDTEDEDFSELFVWQDANSDGVSSPDELHALGDLNIASLSLNPSNDAIFENGNIITDIATYTTASGETRVLADVWFG